MSKVITFILFSLLAIVAVFLILYAPQLLLPDNVQEFDSKEVAFLQLEAHKHMTQIIGGIAVLFALYLIYRRIIALEKNIAIAQEAQLTDRFTRAIEQLGTYKLEVQLGGIFALEKIAKDSSREHWTVMEILSAYVRENAKWNKDATNNSNNLLNGNINGSLDKEKAPTDIQAIMTVIGRRNWLELERNQMRVINLRMTKLSNIDLRRAQMERTNLRGSNLERANLAETNLVNAFIGEANLAGANLVKADLTGANLVGANLENVNFRGANLRGANLMRARLKGALLEGAKLDGANLMEVDLQNGNLCGVSLVNVNLTNTKLLKVKYDYDTIFPDWLNQELKEELKMSFSNG